MSEISRSFYRELTCILSTEERRIYSEELARVTQLQSEIEDAKKESQANYKARIDKCISDSRLFARKISTGKEQRDVEVHWVFDENVPVKYLIRTDTGEMIETSALSQSELQRRLPLDEPETPVVDATMEETASSEEVKEEGSGLVEDEGTEITTCCNTDCANFDKEEANGCTEYANCYECPEAVGATGEVVQ